MTMQFIASATLGSTANAIDFNSIPQTFTHLQVRFFIRSQAANNDFSIGVNGSFSISNCASHALVGNGSSALSGAWTSANFVSLTNPVNLVPSFPSNSVGSGIIDILDYTNTNKNKTIRVLWGSDQNGAGFVALNSGFFATTSAISAVNFFNGFNWAAGTRFDLYGITTSTVTGA